MSAGPDRSGTPGVLTACYGAAPYRKLAVTLARCLDLYAPDLPRAVVTDAPDAPELDAHFDQVIAMSPELGGTLVEKLSMHRYSPFDRTLYIDSDSLIVRELDEVWAAFQGHPFGVVGFEAPSNHWFDREQLPPERRHPEYTVFNSGLFYFDRAGGAVLDDAASMVPHYSDWGITTINGHPNDEPLISIAMASAGLKGLDDDGRFMRSLGGATGPVHIDVLRGRSAFRKYDDMVEPAIVHFAAGAWERMEYRREAVRLALDARHVPRALLAPWPWATRAAAAATRPLRRGQEPSTSLAVRGDREDPQPS